MNKPDFEQFLKESLEQTKDIAPRRDLWKGIENAIASAPLEDKQSSYWPKLTGIAACLLAGLMAWQVVLNQPQQNTMTNMSAFFEQQKQSLLVQYEAQPALTSDWQAQLAELESAEQAIKAALQSDPENAALLQMLAQVYQQQLDLINKVHEPRWQQI
ncbi:hypothetical protein [Pseudoalteromonas byunsanensis]|uniref:Uncharacterized protein n=1 Tax=Pseudoalteromonas byunsanensis TaxID=327939 RepID=A0A1S1NA79_9GAMM|nr:hypothetical protein [Pseudoalteromonas byunsanensis]OHU96266.1 hypothetical protein BIW53_06895 [Pseudoalteromonas byunsanensis]